MEDTVTEERLDKYFSITQEALAKAKVAPTAEPEKTSEILDMVERYVSDAEYFKSLDNPVLAFAALNYAHGWLDCGARLGIFTVKDSRLFTVDDD